jgi:peptide/nickel transport system substrate-binding protein
MERGQTTGTFGGDAVIRLRRVCAILAAVGLISSACTGEGKPVGQVNRQQGDFKRGGVLRIGLASDVQAGFDPAREYYSVGWEFLHCCLTRTLLGFNMKSSAEGGTTLMPDLATALPTASSDGLTWTFNIKSGIHYAPPLQDQTVQAQDFIRALLRKAQPATASSYPFYYSIIEGFDEVTKGRAKRISGLSAPDPSTLVVKLTTPAGYFPYVFTLPAAAPIPPSPRNPSAPLGVATGHDQTYGQFVASTGPYMFKGADQIDYSMLADQRRAPSGFQAGKSYVLVRNPSWERATDPMRKAYVDEIDASVGGTVADLEKRIERGELDAMDAPPDPQGIRAFMTNPSLRPFIHSDPVASILDFVMNLALPPFDDIHVRKAVNWIVDKDGMLQLLGGRTVGTITGHIIPDSMLPGLKGYDPYATPGHSGSLAKAKAEMMRSKYDSNQDGICDAQACRNLLSVSHRENPIPKLFELFRQNLSEIGITLNIKQFESTTAFSTCADAASHTALCSQGWFADFNDPYAFVTGLFSRTSLTPSCCNAHLLGATAQQLAKWNYANSAPTLSIDSQLEACIPTLGDARQSCYEGVDRMLMEQIVPMVPLVFTNGVSVTSSRVENYHLDARAAWISLALIALKNGGE